MGKSHSSRTRNNLAKGAYGRVRSSLALALFSIAVILLGVSLAYSATSHPEPAGPRIEQRLGKGLNPGGQSRLVLRQRSLD